MPTELFCSNSGKCQRGFFSFQRNHLSFQEDALCTSPQRLMKSLELASLGEDRGSNRNMSYAVLIATLITSVKMNGGIAVMLQVHTFGWLPSRWDALLFTANVVCSTPHTVKQHICRLCFQATKCPPLYLSYIFIRIPFTDPFSDTEANEFMKRW